MLVGLRTLKLGDDSLQVVVDLMQAFIRVLSFELQYYVGEFSSLGQGRTGVRRGRVREVGDRTKLNIWDISLSPNTWAERRRHIRMHSMRTLL